VIATALGSALNFNAAQIAPRVLHAKRTTPLQSQKYIRESLGWLGNLDSNQDKQSQSLLCYRYTIPQWIVEQVQ
jgi:hypothetical protein